MPELPFEYKLKRRRGARCIRVTIHPGGECRVNAPCFAPTSLIENFLNQKSSWILSKIEKMKMVKPRVSAKQQRIADRHEYLKYKERARELAESRLNYFNSTYGFSWKKIAIRNQKSRWGSCSKQGNLNFNYKITLLPAELADYIVVHELCHLKEFNHSKRFWGLVGKTIPNYLEIRKKLNKNPLVLGSDSVL